MLDLNYFLKDMRERCAKGWVPKFSGKEPHEGCIYFQMDRTVCTVYPNTHDPAEHDIRASVYANLSRTILEESGFRTSKELIDWNDAVATKQDVLAIVDRAIAKQETVSCSTPPTSVGSVMEPVG